MSQPLTNTYPISDFVEWAFRDQLNLAPKFQRRDVWPSKAKSYLIDSILRQMPIPPLFLRLQFDPINRRTVREVVDGQQRLNAVLSFIKDEFPILKVHNKEYAGKLFSQLPEDVRREFYSYKFTVNTLEGVSDSYVLGIFARINTYTVKLNHQELRNSEFFGSFKQSVYNIALKYYQFWVGMGIFPDYKIARMDEAEMVSEILIAMADDIQDSRNNTIRRYYKLYDDDFPGAQDYENEFDHIISLLGGLDDGFDLQQFRRPALFYSLFLVIYDAVYGLPGSNRPHLRIDAATKQRISTVINELSNIIKFRDDNEVSVFWGHTPHQQARRRDFMSAFFNSPNSKNSRIARHEVLWEEIFG